MRTFLFEFPLQSTSSASPQHCSDGSAADAEVDSRKQRVEDGRREIKDGRVRIVGKIRAQPNQESYNRADLFC